VEVGAQATELVAGDRVLSSGISQRQRTNAQFHVVDEHVVGHAPKSLDPADAAAIPLVAITVWEVPFDRSNVTQKSTGTHSIGPFSGTSHRGGRGLASRIRGMCVGGGRTEAHRPLPGFCRAGFRR
jgi:NADPH:quinone reductase and related Zn-dependent oxidoreductases